MEKAIVDPAAMAIRKRPRVRRVDSFLVGGGARGSGIGGLSVSSKRGLRVVTLLQIDLDLIRIHNVALF